MGIVGQLKSLLGSAASGPLGAPGAVPPAAVDLAARSTAQLRRSHAAGRALGEAVAALAADGRTVLDAVMGGRPFAKWEMYPRQGGVLDQRSNSQYFYHSHEGYRGEHGHFHTFSYDKRRLAHLVAIGVDERGRINRLYTFNRWGPGDHYFPARTLKGFLPRFRVAPNADGDTRVHAFVNAALELFRPEIEALFDARDETFDRYRAAHGGAEPYEDRALEITSILPVDVDARMAGIEAELARRGESPDDRPGDVARDAAPAEPGATEGGPTTAPPLAQRPTAGLKHAYEAGLALRRIDAALRGKGSTVVHTVLNGKALEHWEMYPWDGGVEDRRTRSQYFYHAHPQSPEHGHFHLFCKHKGELVHLAALAMDNRGEPVSLFTVNRWVTGDHYLPAAGLAAYLPRFRMDTKAFAPEVGDYLRQVLALYGPEVTALMHERDAVFAAYRRQHDGAAPYEDRELEVTSTLAVDVDAHVAALEAELRRRGTL